MHDIEKKGRRRTVAVVVSGVVIVIVLLGFWVGPLPPYIEPQLSLIDSVSMDGGYGGDDWALGMVWDSSQQLLYATGFINVPGNGKDGIVWRLNLTLTLEQVGNKTFGGSSGDDVGYALALDGHGHVFAAGYTTEAGEDHNIWIARFNLDLTLEKDVTINGPSNGTDEAYGLTMDDSGAVYVAGAITVPGQGYDIYIGKYDSDLNLQRNITIDGPASMTDKGRFMLLDGTGNLFVSGSMSQVGTGYDIWLGKFDTNLDLLEQKIIAGPTADEDKGYGLCQDADGNLYVTGTITEYGQSYNSWLAKFDKDLNQIKNVTVNGPANGDDTAYSIGFEPDFIIQAGTYTELSGAENIMLALYDTDFRFYDRVTIDGSAKNDSDTAFGVICGPGQPIFVSGFITEISGGQNAWIGCFWIPRPM